jgi:hypothetical protein
MFSFRKMFRKYYVNIIRNYQDPNGKVKIRNLNNGCSQEGYVV